MELSLKLDIVLLICQDLLSFEHIYHRHIKNDYSIEKILILVSLPLINAGYDCLHTLFPPEKFL